MSRPHPSTSYNPPPHYRAHRPDPIERLPGWDELTAELADAIDARFAADDNRHVHATRGGCEGCAVKAADTVVRYLEVNTRIIHSEALSPEEHARARAAMKAMPYIGSGNYLRLTGDLGAHPDNPTVEDLLIDVETLLAGITALVEHDRQREHELNQYRKWRAAVTELATKTVARFDDFDPSTALDTASPTD